MNHVLVLEMFLYTSLIGFVHLLETGLCFLQNKFLKPGTWFVSVWFCFARVIRFMAAILGQVGVVCRPLFYVVFLSHLHPLVSLLLFFGLPVWFPVFSFVLPRWVSRFFSCERIYLLPVLVFGAWLSKNPFFVACDFPLVFTKLCLDVLHRRVCDMYISPLTKPRQAYVKKVKQAADSFLVWDILAC